MSAVNEVNMAKWIVALRSGRYAQGTGRLRMRDAFCCLGVACDISDLGEWVADHKGLPAYRVSRTGSLVYESGAILPAAVADFFFPDADYSKTHNPPLENGAFCASANDLLKWDFSQIAASLETVYLPGKKAEQILEAAP